jgi:hypothetical protein
VCGEENNILYWDDCLEQYKKADFLIPHSTYTKKKSFHLIKAQNEGNHIHRFPKFYLGVKSLAPPMDTPLPPTDSSKQNDERTT